ncbi:MAG TPA: hypothetical protein VJZ27_05470 [Aggregatilineales bacterium]|nr:hypothetical protein [Aggregatilineales bacterium]
MVESIILRGAILLNEDEDTMAMIMMLATALRDNIRYFRYNYANEIELSHNFDFVVTADIRNIQQVRAFYQRNRREPLPRIVHLVTPEKLQTLDYEQICPGMKVSPIPQASLDELDITLNLDIYAGIMEEIRAARQNAVSGA